MRISGKLSSIIKGLIDSKEIIGKPISADGVVIGKILEIDEKLDLYFGKISDNVLINFTIPCNAKEEKDDNYKENCNC